MSSSTLSIANDHQVTVVLQSPKGTGTGRGRGTIIKLHGRAGCVGMAVVVALQSCIWGGVIVVCNMQLATSYS